MENAVLYLYSSLVLVLLLWRWRCSTSSTILQKQSVLVVTAHPDDECMFFGPAITSLLSVGVRVHILCLSTGNWYGQGALRKTEFYRSCSALGVDVSLCSIIDDEGLPDHPTEMWSKELIQTHVTQYVNKHNISALLTFDVYGVSGHVNHVAVATAIADRKYERIPAYELVTVTLLRKYSSWFDLLISTACGESVLLPPFRLLLRPFHAMWVHRSQMMWFRYLYIFSSRYMLFNSIQEIA